MAEHGFRWTPATAGLFVPFEDGTSVQLWDDDRLCEEEIAPVRAGRPGGLAGLQRRQAPAARRACGPRATATSGSAGPRRATRSSAGWRATPRPGAPVRVVDGRVRRAFLRRRAAADRPIWGRGSSARSPARTTRGRRRSTSTTSRAGWAGCRGCGGMSRAGWAWSRSSSATSPARPARSC